MEKETYALLSKQGSFFTYHLIAFLTVLSLWSIPTSARAEENYLNPVPIPIPITTLTLDAGDEAHMIADVNAARTAAGLSPLLRDPQLVSVARAYAHDMAARRYFGHRNPEGKNVGNRFEEAGIAYQTAGENIAFVQNENEAMEGFLNSSGHRANILNSNYTRIGIGIIVTDGYGAVYVQEFSDGASHAGP
jgi:uncharacterized protein YkwD